MKASISHSSKLTGLEEQIQSLENDIDVKCAQLCEQEELLSQYSESLQLVRTKARWLPEPGVLPPLEAFRQHLEGCQTEEQRQLKITEFEAGQKLALSVHSRLEQELIELRSQLTELEEELIWQRDFAHLAPKYESAFPYVPTVKEQQILSIVRMEGNIREHQLRLQKAQDWLRRAEEKQNKSPNLYLESWSYVLPASEVIRSYPSIIAQMQVNLVKEKERDVVDGRDPKVERDFRVFVRGRANIERSLQQFLQAQSLYKQALVDFRQAASENPQAIPFPVSHLPNMPIRTLGIRSGELFVEINEQAQTEVRKRTSW
jgi:tetratricopeptide (TPR) repeat protein